MKKLKVVGLDPSWRSFGIAHIDGSTERIKPPPNKPQSIKLKILVAAVTSAAWEADLAVIEGFSYGSTHQRESLGYLGHTIRAALADIGVPTIDVAPPTLKLFATGNGKASKEAVVINAQTYLGLSEKASDDEADALWLREAGLWLTGRSARIPPSRSVGALAEIELPKDLLPKGKK